MEALEPKRPPLTQAQKVQAKQRIIRGPHPDLKILTLENVRKEQA